jgi:uncharacterized membrane protein YuzA (DUF378 family)
MKKTDLTALALVIVGALNWGLVAIASFDLVAEVFGMSFGDTNAASRVVYGLVGLSGVWLAVRAKALLATPAPVAAGARPHRDRVSA